MIATVAYYLCILWAILFFVCLITGIVYLFMSYDLNGECPDDCADCQIGPCFDINATRAQMFLLAAIGFGVGVPLTALLGSAVMKGKVVDSQ